MSLLRATKRTKKRLLHHFRLALASFALTILLYAVLLWFYPDPLRWVFRWSLATGYVAAALLAITLSIGAWKILCGRSNPVSTDLRRDIGIWCGVLSSVHVVVGLNVHFNSWMQYFMTEAGGVRTDFFGLANYSGLAATLVIAILLATSNDFSLTVLKSRRWKAIQRWNYFFAALVALHAFLYIAVEKRIVPFVFIFGAFAIWTLTIQACGFQKRRQAGREGLVADISE